jgi:putative transposase
MPGLKGFVKTMRYKVAVPDDISVQMLTTVEQYRSVVAYYLQFFQNNLDILDSKYWLRKTEALTHHTKDNPSPKYDFDYLYPRYPSGFRRAAISDAFGLALAWRSNYHRWQKQRQEQEEKNLKRIAMGKKPIAFKDHPPLYPYQTTDWPSFYGTECRILDSSHIKLKLYTGSAYTYRRVRLIEPINIPEGYKSGSPTLVYKPSGWELHIPIALQERLHLSKITDSVKNADLKICAVDRGINNHVVMTIQDTKGRVYATRIISGTRDNHLRKRYLEKIARLQRQSGSIPKDEFFAKDLWNKVRNFNDNIAHTVSRQIVNFAKKYGAAIIVFEYLKSLKPTKGTKSRKLNHKLGYWVKGRVLKYTKYKAIFEGIVTCQVTPKNTSKRCPYCGMLTINRYSENGNGVDLAKCSNCFIEGLNSDFVGSVGVGTNFRLKYCS